MAMQQARINYGKQDRISQAAIVLIMAVLALICLYPFLYTISMSISDPMLIAVHPVILLPRGLSIKAYTQLLSKKMIWGYYGNTLFYTGFGTLINIALTVMLAYPLSVRTFSGRKVITVLTTFTMLFSGGLIPTYMLISNIGLYGTRWALLLPSAISVFNMIIARTFFSGISPSMAESAKLDGANDIQILFLIILPVSKAIVATLCIYYAVAHWNSYLPALLYQPDSSMHPLQMFLVKVLINADEALVAGYEEGSDRSFVEQQLKYCTIVISALPIICVYPFFQKYLTKGAMLGSIKE